MFQLRSRWPKLVASMNESERDVLAYMNFPTPAPEQAAQRQPAAGSPEVFHSCDQSWVDPTHAAAVAKANGWSRTRKE
jgi:hypothetical protein